MDNLLLENADLHLFLQRTESGDGTRASGLTKGDHGGMGRGSGGGPGVFPFSRGPHTGASGVPGLLNCSRTV